MRTGRTYTPGKTHNYETAVRAAYLSKYPSGQWVTNKEQPISADITFYFEMPSSWSRKKKERNEGKLCLKHIDLDNCYKSVTDALNGLAYPDDSQICIAGKIKKVWSTKEYVEVCLTEVAEE
jgi:Holliday junction resolvase RusA-like endonuclease